MAVVAMLRNEPAFGSCACGVSSIYYTASDFNRALAAGGAAGKRVVVDLSHCRYIEAPASRC